MWVIWNTVINRAVDLGKQIFCSLLYVIIKGGLVVVEDSMILFDFDGIYKTQDFYMDYSHQ